MLGWLPSLLSACDTTMSSPRFWKLFSAFAFTDLGVARLAPPFLELSHESSFSLPIPLTGVS